MLHQHKYCNPFDIRNEKVIKYLFPPSQRLQTVPQTTSDPLPATSSTSHPAVGYEILFQGDNPIVAECVLLDRQSVHLLTPISIIFVHGLRGHRRDTWTKQGICWPKDLLGIEPALSNVRILSFGYDSRVVVFGGRVSLNSIFKHSMSFLNGLCREREDVVGIVFTSTSSRLKAIQNQQDRPIIFIAHSLGGLIVKDVR